MSAAKILVCDDEAHILHVVATKLKNNGYEVVTAADGEEGYELARQHKPDLVITDYQMPFLSGLELCAKLRGDAATSAIPVIMLTARGFSMGEEELKNTNIQRVLPKPFSPREVLKSVEEILKSAAAGAAR
jgi:DNA-binding response OmpR family regulator